MITKYLFYTKDFIKQPKYQFAGFAFQIRDEKVHNDRKLLNNLNHIIVI